MSHLSLSPVAAGVYTVLNVAAVTDLAVGGVHDDVPQDPTFPFVWYEVQEEEARGFGTGGLPEVDLRVHAFSQYAGMKEAQDIIRECVELLRDGSVTVAGYSHWATFYDRTIPLANEVLNGVKVKELVAQFRMFVEE